MFELYITIILAILVWGRPLYKLIVKKEDIDQSTVLLAPIAYFAFYLVITAKPINEESYIYEGFQDRLIQCFLIMHIFVFVVVTIFESRKKD